MLDELHGLIKKTKQANEEERNEIKTHTPLLQNLEGTMDRVKSKMTRTENRLDKYIEKSSNSCLMTVICLEIVLMLIIIIAL